MTIHGKYQIKILGSGHEILTNKNCVTGTINRNQKIVSIIVPIFNGEAYLKQCIESVIGIFSMQVELILVNDGSTDRTDEICQRYKKNYPQDIIYYKQNNLGVVAARKRGIDLANGEWLLFLDADDWIEIDKSIFDYLNYSEDTGIDIIAYRLIKETGEKGRQCLMPRISSGIYEGKTLALSSIRDVFFKLEIVNSMYAGFMRKSLIFPILMVEPNDITWSEDGACMMLAYWDARKVIILDHVVYHYRVHKNSITHMHNKHLLFSQISFYKFLKEEFICRKAWNLMKKNVISLMIRDFMIGDYKPLFNICNDYLFPYTDIKPGMRIALYGMGEMGKEYFRVLNGNCSYKLIFIGDKNSVPYCLGDKRVLSLPEVKDKQDCVDKIAITVTDIELANNIKNELIEVGVDALKISIIEQHVIDEIIIERMLSSVN